MNTQAHKVVEFFQRKKDSRANLFSAIYSNAIIFDAGELETIPFITLNPSQITARPPFEVSIFVFDWQGIEVYVFLSYRVENDTSSIIFVIGKNGIYTYTGSLFEYKGLIHRTLQEDETAISTKVAGYLNASLLNFFEVLACSNVTTVDVEAPHALNKKRIKAGKLPIKSHKVLHLVAPSTHADSPSQGGTHASPRVHLRRGHIRKLPNGTTVWVQQAVVGSKHGIVTKDYSVSYSGAPA